MNHMFSRDFCGACGRIIFKCKFSFIFDKNGQCLCGRLAPGESSSEHLLPSSLAFLSSAYQADDSVKVLLSKYL